MGACGHKHAEAWVPGPLGVTGAFVTKWGFPWA